MNSQPLPVLNLNQDIECWRSAAFKYSLLGSAAAGFFIRQGDAFNTANQIGQGWIEQQVFDVITVGSANKLDTSFVDGAGGGRV
jgi:hypothetical protein